MPLLVQKPCVYLHCHITCESAAKQRRSESGEARTAKYPHNVQIWSVSWQRHRHGAFFYPWKPLLKQQIFFFKAKAFGLPEVPNIPMCRSVGFPLYHSKQAEGRCNAAWQTKQHFLISQPNSAPHILVSSPETSNLYSQVIWQRTDPILMLVKPVVLLKTLISQK